MTCAGWSNPTQVFILLIYPWLGARWYHHSQVWSSPATHWQQKWRKSERYDVIRATMTQAPGWFPAVEPLSKNNLKTCPFFLTRMVRVLDTKNNTPNMNSLTQKCIVILIKAWLAFITWISDHLNNDSPNNRISVCYVLI